MVTANLGPDVPPDDGSDSAGIDRLTSALEKLESTLKQKNRTTRYNPRDPGTPLTDVIGSNTRRVVQIEAERLTKKFVEITFTGSITQGQLKKVNGEFKRFSDMLNKAVKQGFAKPKEREVALDKVQGALNLVERVADRTSQAKLQAEQKKAEDQQIRDLRKSTKEQEARRRRVQSSLSSQQSREYVRSINDEIRQQRQGAKVVTSLSKQQSREYVKDLSEEEKARKLWRRGLDKQAENASKEENAARRLWRRGLDRQEAMRAQEAEQAKNEAKARNDRRRSFAANVQNRLDVNPAVTVSMITRAMQLGMPKFAASLRGRYDAQQQARINQQDAAAKQAQRDQQKGLLSRLTSKLQAGIPLNKGDLASAIRLGMNATVTDKIKDVLKRQSQKEEAKKTTDKQLKAAQAQSDFLKSVTTKMSVGGRITMSDLVKASKLGVSSASQKSIVDYYMKQQKADQDKKAANSSGAGSGGFFGGIARNLAIGVMYRVLRPGMEVVGKTVSGLLQKPLEFVEKLGNFSHDAALQLSYMSGVAGVATQAINSLAVDQAYLTRLNYSAAMRTDRAGAIAGGIAGSASGMGAGAAGAFMGAVQNPLTGFTDIVSKIGGAVNLFDPGAMVQYNLVLRDVTATIGSAMAPVVKSISSVMKTFGDYLKPVVEGVMPQITSALSQLVTAITPIIPIFVNELKTVAIEFIDQLKEWAKDTQAVRSTIRTMLGAPETAASWWRAFMRMALVGVTTLIGSLVAGIPGFFAGAAIGTAINNTINSGSRKKLNLEKGNVTGTAVATNAKLGSAVDLGREAAQQAFIASSSSALNKNKMESVMDEALTWFSKQNQSKTSVVSGEGPGVASGKPKGHYIDTGIKAGYNTGGGMTGLGF